jgi:hypothetical protein
MFGRQHALLISVRSGGLLLTQYAAYLGIDWADKKHDLCLVDGATGRKTKQVLAPTPQTIAEYFSKLFNRASYNACRRCSLSLAGSPLL